MDTHVHVQLPYGLKGAAFQLEPMALLLLGFYPRAVDCCMKEHPYAKMVLDKYPTATPVQGKKSQDSLARNTDCPKLHANPKDDVHVIVKYGTT